MWFANASVIGLDVGSGLVKAVTLRRKGKRLLVERAGLAAMAGGAISGRKFLDPPAIADCIRRLCKDLGIRGRRAAVALAGDEVLHARLKVERTSLESLETLVREELSREASFPLSEAVIDYQVLDNFSHSQWVDVVAVAGRQAAVQRHQQVLERAGKSAAVVDSAACALANAFDVNYLPAANEITALMNLGAATITVCVLRGSTPLLARDVTLDATKPWREQEAPAERVAIELERVFEEMDEIADDHPLEPRSRQIARVMLSGGGIRLRGLEDVLRARLKLQFEELNPFRKIEFTGTDSLSRLVWDQVHCMPIAVGLALHGVLPPGSEEPAA